MSFQDNTNVGNPVTVKYGLSPLDSYNDHGDTPLICAARAGHTDICQLLLEAGADVNQTTVFLNQSALLVSIECCPDAVG